MIFARNLLDRLLITADVLPKSQYCFRLSRGTIDMIFCARLLQEKSQEQQQTAMFIVWDLKKMFHKVPVQQTSIKVQFQTHFPSQAFSNKGVIYLQPAFFAINGSHIQRDST